MNMFSKLAVPASLGLLLSACSGGATGPLSGAGQSLPQAQSRNVASPADDKIVFSSEHDMQIYRPGAKPDLTGELIYRGGPVQHATKIYVVFWQFQNGGDPNGEQAYLTSFLNGVGASSWLNTVTQYYDGNGNIQNNPNQLVKIWNDNKTAIPQYPSKLQVQAEGLKLAKKFGFSPDASYVVATPHNHSTPGFGTSWCAYHGLGSNSKGSAAFTNLPYQSDAGGSCGEGLVTHPGTLDGVSIVEGHELAETQTDPSPGRGWTSSGGSEIGDLCAWQDLQDTTFTTGKFPTQPLWSDVSNGCVQSGP